MNLQDRIKTIISENTLKQKDFAKSINVTDSYISKLLRGESGLSKSTAALIEEIYGYSIDWIFNGTEPKMKNPSQDKNLSPNHRKILAEIENMSEDELIAVRAFIHSLDSIKKASRQ